MVELISLPNIGKEMETKLKSVGIMNAEQLKESGSKQAFAKLKLKYANVCLVHLYCLQGAIDLIDYTELTPEMKKKLKQFSDHLKE